MTGEALKAAREEAKRTQAETAGKLGLTQAYLSMIEGGRRPVTEELQVKAVRVFHLAPTALPLKVDPQGALDEKGFKAELGALGYPGFAKFRVGRPKYNPARLLLLAICQDDLDRAVVEALPLLGHFRKTRRPKVRLRPTHSASFLRKAAEMMGHGGL